MLPETMWCEGHLGGYIQGGHHSTFCPNLWSWIVRKYRIQSVLDVGCGEGHSTKFFRDLGCDVLGVDGCQKAIDDSVIPDHMVKHDFCDGPFLPGRSFDLIWSCEFLEHVEPRYVGNILDTFRCATKLALVTHALPQQPGHHHVNCKRSSYWIDLFGRIGLVCNVGLTLRSRWAAFQDSQARNFYSRTGLAFVNPTSENLTRNAIPLQHPTIEKAPKLNVRAHVQGFAVSGAGKILRHGYRRIRKSS